MKKYNIDIVVVGLQSKHMQAQILVTDVQTSELVQSIGFDSFEAAQSYYEFLIDATSKQKETIFKRVA